MKHFKYFVTERMLEDCIELAARDDVVAQDSLPVGELGTYEGVTFITTPEPCQPAADMEDQRLTSKCKRRRREARGW